MIGELLPVAYAVACIVIVLYLVTLASRLVEAHERIADALDKIADKDQGDSKSSKI
jgi:Ca2+/H+ antiporter